MDAPAHRNRMAARHDLAIFAFAVSLFAGFSVRFELSEAIAAWTRPYEYWQLDEVPGLLVFVAAGLAWYAWRRVREGRLLLRQLIVEQGRLSVAIEENRTLAMAAVRAQENERRRLARELHDELGQYVNAIKVDAVWLRELGQRQSPDVLRGAESIVAMTDHLQGAVGAIVRRLRPPGLDELGLAAALEECIDGWRRRLPGVAFDVAVDERICGVDEATSITLFRMAQEGLTNLARHARAANVQIRVLQQASAAGTPFEIVLSMRDDGIGTGARAAGAGLGLIGMRERVEALAGRFELLPLDVHGFGFVAHLPWRGAGAA